MHTDRVACRWGVSGRCCSRRLLGKKEGKKKGKKDRRGGQCELAESGRNRSPADAAPRQLPARSCLQIQAPGRTQAGSILGLGAQPGLGQAAVGRGTCRERPWSACTAGGGTARTAGPASRQQGTAALPEPGSWHWGGGTLAPERTTCELPQGHSNVSQSLFLQQREKRASWEGKRAAASL